MHIAALAAHRPIHQAGSPDVTIAPMTPAAEPAPAASQAHGTVYAGVALGVVAPAVTAAFLVGGVGPVRASIASAGPAGDGLLLTLEVGNDGSREGRAACRVRDPAYLRNPPAETYVRTSPIPARGSRAVEQRVTALGSATRLLAVDCSR